MAQGPDLDIENLPTEDSKNKVAEMLGDYNDYCVGKGGRSLEQLRRVELTDQERAVFDNMIMHIDVVMSVFRRRKK